jgi:hypothetical protein
MVGYMNLEERVDKDFSLARRKASLGRAGAPLRRNAGSNRLLCFDDLRTIPGAVGRIYRGLRMASVAQIGGSMGRCSEFDGDFMPTRASVEERWKCIDRAFYRGEVLPPVSLYKVGSFYFVLDGHHRLSVARYHGVEWIDAHVTEFDAGAGVWSDPTRDRERLIKRSTSRRSEPRMHEMVDFQLWKQRREELLREAELSYQAKALRAARKRRDGRRLALVWEAKRHAGRLVKYLKALRNAS